MTATIMPANIKLTVKNKKVVLKILDLGFIPNEIIEAIHAIPSFIIILITNGTLTKNKTTEIIEAVAAASNIRYLPA